MDNSESTFCGWDPIHGEIPSHAPQEFLPAVRKVRCMLMERTWPELLAALKIIREEYSRWVESKKGEALEKLRDRALAGDQDAMSFFLWEIDRNNAVTITGYRLGAEWVATASMSQIMDFFKREELRGIFLRYFHEDEFYVLKEQISKLRRDLPSFPTARPFEYFSVLALCKAAMTVEAMAEVASLQDLMEDFFLSDDLNKRRRDLLHYFEAVKKVRNLTNLFLEISEYAHCLFAEEPRKEIMEPPIDPQVKRDVMSALGKRGATIANWKRREVRRFVEELFREGWLENRWRNPHQAAMALLPLAQTKAEELKATHCLDGEYSRAFKTVYDLWILPLCRRLRLGNVPHSAAGCSTVDRQME
ncbi:MAG: hypothetical protein KA419_08440 [Acidobacteria bacterium]|nr:hypothetical protein [Acidobacteriota bacterium]